MATIKVKNKTQDDGYLGFYIMISPSLEWYDYNETVVWPDAFSMPEIQDKISELAANGVDVSDIEIYPIDINTCFKVSENIKITIE